MWYEVTEDNKELIEKFAGIVMRGAEHYARKYSPDLAGSYLQEKNGKKGHLFIYEDDTYRIALAFTWSSKDMWKIANGLVERVRPGVGDAFEVTQIAARKMREFVDETKVYKAYSLTPNLSFNEFQDEFHTLYASTLWEHTKVLDTEHVSDEFPDGIWLNVFDRTDRSRVVEDEIWDNPEVA